MSYIATPRAGMALLSVAFALVGLVACGGGGGGGGGGGVGVGAAAGSEPALNEADPLQPASADVTSAALASAITNADLPNIFEIPPLTLGVCAEPSSGQFP